MRKTLLIIAITLPVFFLFNVVQAYEFEKFRREVKAKVEQQQDWVDKNKRLAGGITVLSSPQRIDDLAKNVLGLPKGEKEVKVIYTPGKKIDG